MLYPLHSKWAKWWLVIEAVASRLLSKALMRISLSASLVFCLSASLVRHLYKHTCIFIKYVLLNVYFRLKSNDHLRLVVESFKMTWNLLVGFCERNF